MKIARIVCGIEPGGHGVGAAVRAARIAPDETPLVLVGAADIGAAAMAQPLGGDIDMGPMPAGPWTSLEDLEDAVRDDLERAERALAGRPGVATRIQVGSLAPAGAFISSSPISRKPSARLRDRGSCPSARSMPI